MKSIYTLLLVPLLALTGCKNDQENPDHIRKGSISFPVSLLGDVDARIAQTLPVGTHLRISIETSEGVTVLTQHRMEILLFDGSIVSQALELNVGNYRLTEFLVMNQQNEILYATPLEHSALADLVDEPMPINFSVAEGAAVQVAVQVLNVALLTPADIGYASFPFSIVNHFFLTVFTQIPTGLALTDATGYILQNADTLRHLHVEPKINTVAFSGDPDGTFTLVVVKAGFGKHVQTFTLNDITSSHAQGIVPVTLLPALTFVAVPYQSYEEALPVFEFSLNFTGSLTIDWGDGSIEGVCPTFDNYFHEYGHPGAYFVSVTGDIENITEFKSYYGMGPISEIDLSHLPALVDFRSGYNGSGVSPKVIDLSHNPLLTYVDVSLSQDLEELILPETNRITSLSIQATNNLTPTALESVIATIYASVVATGRQSGYIDLASPIDGSVTGPPSPTTSTQLSSLWNDYFWTIYPEQ